jgi:hypothetical protein
MVSINFLTQLGNKETKIYFSKVQFSIYTITIMFSFKFMMKIKIFFYQQTLEIEQILIT